MRGFLLASVTAGILAAIGCGRESAPAAGEKETAVSVPASVGAPKVRLSGKAQSCHPGLPIRLVGVPGVNVSAFDVSRVPMLSATMKKFQASTITDEASMMRLDRLSRTADSLVENSVALVRVTSDSNGDFELIIPPTDSVLIYGLNHDEDDPVNQTFMTIGGRADSSFILDISGGGCSP